MRGKWRRINAVLLALLILMDGFSGFFTENRVLANEGYPGSELVESLELRTSEIDDGECFNVLAKISGQTEDPEGEKYITSGQEILIPIASEEGTNLEFIPEQSQIEKTEVTLGDEGLRIKFLEGIEQEQQVLLNLNLVFKGTNTDENAEHKITIANDHEIMIHPKTDDLAKEEIEEIKAEETLEGEADTTGFRSVGANEPVTNTFESDGGDYSLDYILNNYNVFVSGDFTGTHVMGAVVTGGGFKGSLGGVSGTTPFEGGVHQVPSYIKGKAEISGDTIYTDVAPYFGTINKGKFNELCLTNSSGEIEHITKPDDRAQYSDDYVDFNKWEDLKRQAEKISQKPSVIISSKNGKLISSNPEVVKINEGSSRIDVPAGNVVFFVSGDLSQFELNIVGSASDSNTIIASNSAEISLPRTYINGVLPGSIEVESEGVSLVYSFPNASSVLVTPEITGHIVAPYADVKLNGGNFNGCIIANNVVSSAQGHMWPYTGPGLTKINIPVTKVWDDQENQAGKRPESVTVQLLADGREVEGKTLTLNDENGWSASFLGLDEGPNYEIKELNVGEGYTSNVTGDMENGYTVTNTFNSEKINIPITKVWEDNNNQDGVRPTSVEIQLLANGKETGNSLLLEEANNWRGSFTDLNEYKDGQKIKYTVLEKTVANDYTSVVTGEASSGYTITNTRKPEETVVEGSKTWDDQDNQDGKRPKSITITLLGDGEEVASKTVSEKDDWSWKFENLAKFSEGKEVVYTVKESEVPGYDSQVDGYNVTNIHTPEKVNVEGHKTWKDNNNQDGKRPEVIKITLLGDGKEVASRTVTEKDNWNWKFENLDKFKDGKKVIYTVKESKVPGYTSNVDGYNVTNTHEIEQVNIEGNKTWNDNNNQDGKRPESITITLLGDGKELSSKTVTEKDNWSWKFENLDKFKDGKKVVYTVKESKVPGYTSEVDGYNITNTHEIEQVNIEGNKTWKDNDNQDGKRPESITIILLGDGKEVASKTITSNDNWSWKFENLAKYKAGKEVLYTVKEDKVPGYTSKVDGYNVTNTHAIDKVKVEGSKPGMIRTTKMENAQKRLLLPF